MENDFKTAISLLRQGQPPGNRDVLNEISVGLKPFIGFLKEKYLQEYISQGGSKIKFVTGKTGSGKTHFLQLLSATAIETGFVTVHFSAKDIWIHDFKDIYTEIFKRSNFLHYLKICAKRVIRELGYDPAVIAHDMTFADYLSGIGELDALTKREIRNQLQHMFLKNPLIDNNFAVACSLLTGSLLGHPVLEAANRDLLLLWLSGSKDIKLPALRRLGLSPAKITKFNARHMLRSLAEVCRLASMPGLLVMIDNLDILIDSGPLDTIRYTKLKREDAYESIRELIDEIDTLRNIIFVYAFDKKLIDNELNGLKSYQALWMRIQNEIVSDRFNQFTDIIDLDKLGRYVYTKEVIMDMSDRLARTVNTIDYNAKPIEEAVACELLSKVQFANEALPRQVGFKTMNREAEGESSEAPDDHPEKPSGFLGTLDEEATVYDRL